MRRDEDYEHSVFETCLPRLSSIVDQLLTPSPSITQVQPYIVVWLNHIYLYSYRLQELGLGLPLWQNRLDTCNTRSRRLLPFCRLSL